MQGLILVATLAILPVLAQKLSADNEVLLDSSRPSAYLESSETDLNSDGQSAVWLRLHNNSKGAISIRTESLYIGEKVQPLTLGNGKGVLAIRPGTIVAPCYTVEGFLVSSEGRSQTINQQPYQRLSLGSACTVGATSWLPPGGSVRLLIPSGHLSSGRRIGIAFEYEWENARNLEHWVYFSNID